MIKYIQFSAATIIVLSFLLSSGCRKDDDCTTCSDNSLFSGIAQTDSMGVLIEDDSTDWQPRWDYNWIPMGYTPPDKKLFAVPAYPNPTGRDSIAFGFNEHKMGCNIKFAIIDSSYVEAKVYDKPNSCITTLVMDTLNPGLYSLVWELQDSLHRPVPDGIYRVIITARNEETHGDIQVLR